MVVRVRRWWVSALVFGLLGVAALAHYRLAGSGDVLAALALVPIMVVARMRLTADGSGVNIVNLTRRVHIPWAEIEGFRMGWVGLSTCLDVRRKNGTRVHAWVVTTTGLSSYSQDQTDAILAELRQRLARAAGEDPETADARALEDALRAAERRDYSVLDDLVADRRVNPEELWDRLHNLASQGRIDLDDLRRGAPPLPTLRWWDRILLPRRTRELLAANEKVTTR